MSFGGLKTFYGGLEGVLGPPAADLDAGMQREHCKARDSQVQFEATNYGTRSTSEVEFAFVSEPQPVLEGSLEHRQRIFDVVDGNSSHELNVDRDGWPSETYLAKFPDDSMEGKWRRTPRPLEEFRKHMAQHNERLVAADHTELQMLEVVGARLYTGPLYIKYNAVLRGYPDYATRQAHSRFNELCHGNTCGPCDA
jgi:hypothetical protein